MIRVAFVVATFDVGGLERCVSRLVNHLNPTRFKPMVVSLGRIGAAAEWIERSDAPVVSLGKTRGNDPRLAMRFARLLRDQKVDVVHSHNWGTLVETVVARRWARTPIHVHAERGTVLDGLNLTGPRRWLRATAMRWALGRADRVLAVDRSVRSRVDLMTGFPENRVEVVVNGVDSPACLDPLEARREIRASLGLGDDDWLMGSVGRLAPVKDFGTVVEATAALRRKGSRAHLVLVGDGPELSRLKEVAKRSGAEPIVHFVGRRNNVGDWLAAMDLYVNCSVSEGMSQSVLEAMAAGLPIAATNVGANAEIIGAPGDSSTDACGRIVPAGDCAALAQAIGAILSDESLRKRFAASAVQRHRTLYNVRSMVDRYESIYSDLMQAKVQRA